MPEVSFPYGKGERRYQIPDDRYAGSLVPRLHTYVPAHTQEELVQEALEHPIGSARLCELAKEKQKVVILASDHTRPVPSRVIAPLMLKEIRRGNPSAEITFLIATGCHRKTTREELRDKFGEEIVERERIVVHDPDDAAMLVDVGRLPSGGRMVLNRLAVEADLLVAEGFIEPHFFAGFSGGRKSVLPGVASRETVLYDHNAGFIDDPHARTGSIDGNPIHRDMLCAAEAAGLAFICNVVIDARKKIIYAVSGHMDQAHRKGRTFLDEHCRVPRRPSDIVITSNGGYPLDQNIYQAVKGMTAAEATVKEGGVIIMLAASSDGDGGAVFRKTFREQKDVRTLMERFRSTPAEKTIVDQWQSQIFARILMHATVIYLSEAPDEMVEELHMIPAHSIEEAVEIADRLLAEKGVERGSILAIPDGVSVIVG